MESKLRVPPGPWYDNEGRARRNSARSLSACGPLIKEAARGRFQSSFVPIFLRADQTPPRESQNFRLVTACRPLCFSSRQLRKLSTP